ncbi:response regulator consisting of a CheY-like receiver domain [Clostridium sp. SY8519]|uniref:response regulator transcription factor n=1 Tax=Clostridium sp. (strain SY8519) TaxID=1042156 RepID=UPI0002171ADE|nr:response regulator transcription factor [Clostridium sp. SY8519]BAK47541.1 response regulator consisting of a CheY-like receiver domain [Clostridium sp. SY8519]
MTDSTETKILVIEDDRDIREGIRILLEGEGYAVEEAENGMEGLKKLDTDMDLVILDIMMPGISGLKTCEEIRKTSYVPVLFLTAKSKESDKLIGLMAGADDYLCKPFSYSELLGRVKALVRRYQIYSGKGQPQQTQQDTILEIGEIRLDTARNDVWVRGEEIHLSDIEYHILMLLMQYPGKVFSAQNIFESVWNEPYFYNSSGTIMVHIRKLRLKIERDPQNPKHIKTVWGKGYRFE